MERNLWAEPMLLKRCILRSRRRVGSTENCLRLRGPSGAQFEFTLAAIAQNLLIGIA